MKKLLSVMAIAALALLCSCAKTETETTVSTTAKPTVTTEAETTVTEEDSTVTEPVTTQTAAVTTKPAATKKTKPTEPTEKPTKKQETQTTKPVPTQGKTKPHTKVAVTFPRGSFGGSDLVFRKGSVTIKLNDKIGVIDKLKGDPEITESGDERKDYEFDDFIISSYLDDDEVERIYKIEVFENTIETSKGIRIGEYASKLRKVYGDPLKRTKTAYYYGNDEKQLIFEYSNNKIEEIYYRMDI